MAEAPWDTLIHPPQVDNGRRQAQERPLPVMGLVLKSFQGRVLGDVGEWGEERLRLHWAMILCLHSLAPVIDPNGSDRSGKTYRQSANATRFSRRKIPTLSPHGHASAPPPGRAPGGQTSSVSMACSWSREVIASYTQTSVYLKHV